MLALWSPLVAQEPAPKADPKPVPAPIVDAEERAITGSLDVGYRARTDVAGSFNAYRSVVDLGEGPKLFGAEFTVADPRKRLFDRLDVRAYNWGDDPYSTLHVTARKARLYNFTADHRNIAYFNALPSFADPLLDRGVILSERSFDIRRRMSSFELDLRPGSWLIPYLAYDRNSESGNGITTFVTDANEYPLPQRIHDSAGNYRGGIRFELPRFHVTLEQGGTTFRDDQQVFTSSSARNSGNNNNNVPVFGQTLFLTNLQQAYGIRGTSTYSKGLFTASPVSWSDLYGQFLYSQPSSDVSYQQFDTGNFVALSQALVFTGQQYLVSAASTLPHSYGSFGAEIRPLRRVRIIESWLTDRFHNSGSSQTSQLLTPASAQPQLSPQSSRLVSNYNQQQVDVLIDLTKKLTLRGGYRYVWGEASTLALPVSGLLTPDAGELRRSVGIGGFSFRPGAKFALSADIEKASSDRTYFRTSLNDYTKLRVKARYQALASLSVSADMSLLDNQNPATAVRYDYLARQNSLALLWAPQGGKRYTLQADYTRSTLRSDISYLIPQELRATQSIYRENAHVSSAVLDVALPGYQKLTPKLSVGGSLYISSGSRPTSYYQPLVKIFVPVSAHVAWVSDWRYYGFGEALYAYEAFRTHLFTTGLRFTR
jgi:hypothetical protein